MKLTQSKLKTLIKEVLSEVYKLSPEDEKRRKELGIDPNNPQMSQNDAMHLRRAYGLQDEDEIETERRLMQNYQWALKNAPGNEGQALIKAFTSGIRPQSDGQKEKKVTVYHSITYSSFIERQGKIDITNGTPFTDWLKKFGKNRKDSISTVATTEPLGAMHAGSSNFNYQVLEGAGFTMKGYPVMIGSEDMFTQTLGKLPKGLKQHQKNSGIAKRSSDAAFGKGIINFDFKVANEVILDNWSPTACYIHEHYLSYAKGKIMTTRLAISLLKDGQNTGLPFYTLNDYGPFPCNNDEDIMNVLMRTCWEWLTNDPDEAMSDFDGYVKKLLNEYDKTGKLI